MNDILDDLNSWLDLLVVDRRYRQQAGEEPGTDMDLVTRAIDEIACLAASWQQRKTQAPETSSSRDRDNRRKRGVGSRHASVATEHAAIEGARARVGPFNRDSWENFYRRLALEARERAAQATSPSAQAALEKAAAEWSELADWVER